jgi:hypothetical protein
MPYIIEIQSFASRFEGVSAASGHSQIPRNNGKRRLCWHLIPLNAGKTFYIKKCLTLNLMDLQSWWFLPDFINYHRDKKKHCSASSPPLWLIQWKQSPVPIGCFRQSQPYFCLALLIPPPIVIFFKSDRNNNKK